MLGDADDGRRPTLQRKIHEKCPNFKMSGNDFAACMWVKQKSPAAVVNAWGRREVSAAELSCTWAKIREGDGQRLSNPFAFRQLKLPTRMLQQFSKRPERALGGIWGENALDTPNHAAYSRHWKANESSG
jgi:hypothetical protein